MKLLFYSHSFAPNIGGIENITMSLAGGLAERHGTNGAAEFAVTLITQTAARDFDDRSLPFSVIRKPGLAGLWRAIRAADVLHLAGPALLPLILAKLARKPVVIEHHGYQAICPNGLLVQQPGAQICPGHFQAGNYAKCLRCCAAETSWLRSFMHLLEMFPRYRLTRRAARNIAISQHEQRRLALPTSTLIYHGVDDSRQGAAPRSAAPSVGEKICFAYVGRLVPEKGLPVLLQAAQILKSQANRFEILLVGDGPERRKLETLIQKSGLQEIVRGTGFLNGAALAKQLGRVHVVVMPSAWEETAGLAAIEQMMRGRLVIASRIGGLGEIVGEAGLTFEAGDAQELAQCLQRVLQNPALIESLGHAARDRAQTLFLRESMLASHAGIYGEVLKLAHNGERNE
jgi:glycogen synthase